MSIKLSGKQRKAADRVAGIELMIPWPADLPPPRGLAENEERAPTAAEERWVRDQLGDLMARDLVCVRVAAVVVCRPAACDLPAHGEVRPHLAAIIIGRRWVHASTRTPPTTMWYTIGIDTGSKMS